MLKRIRFENMLKSKSAAGLEVIVLPDGSYQLYLIILKKQQTTLVTEKQSKELSSFSEVQQLIDPKVPLILIINGKGIVHRKVHNNENDTAASLLNKLLPNANADDFVIQQTPVNAQEVFVSVIRTNALNDLINELVNHRLTNLSACFLGPFAVANLIPLLENTAIQNEHLHLHNFRLQIREQQITAIDITTESPVNQIRIGNDLLPSQLLIAFAAALSYFTGNQNDISNSGLLNQLKEEFSQKQKFELRGWAILISAFVILMINYFVFENYRNRNKEMNAELELTQAALQRYDTLKTDYDKKKQFLEQNGLLENSRTSYYADRLAKELPASVQLTGLNIHPLKKKNPGEEDKGFLFENKLIHVAGNCRRNTELNEWMKKMKKQDWTEDVVLLNYTQDNMNENGIFLIEIKLK